MHRKVGQDSVTLYGGHRQSGFLHVIEHLRKDPKIEGRRAEAIYSSYRPCGDKQEKRKGEAAGNPKVCPVFLSAGCARFGASVPSVNAEDDQQGQNQNTYHKIRPCKRRAQRRGSQKREKGGKSPPFGAGRINKAGDSGKENGSAKRDCGDPEQGHLRHALQPRQIPQLFRQKQEFHCNGKQP